MDEIKQTSISSNKIKFTKNDLSIIEKCLDKEYADEYLKEMKYKK